MDGPEIQLTVKRKKIEPINGPGLVWMLIILMLLFLALSVGFFSKAGGNGVVVESPTPTPEPTDTRILRIYTVSYKNGVFSPTNLRIHAGDTVRFKNESLFSLRILSDSYLGFDSVGEVPQGSFFSFTFAAKGIFDYHNNSNAEEKGTIIVR